MSGIRNPTSFVIEPKFHLKICVIAGMQLVMEIVAEYRHRHTRLYILEEARGQVNCVTV